MRISIITINYNNKNGLKKTIKSVMLQNYGNLEYIIIDGKSVDGSVELIKKYESKLSYWVSEKDAGIYPAMNKGIEKATGDYLMFLNSGDYLLTADVISECVAELIKNAYVDILYGDMLIPVETEPKASEKITHPKHLDLFFLKNNNINHQASLIRGQLFTLIGLYPLEYKLAGDYWLYITCFIKNFKFKKLEKTMVYYDYSGVSKTNRDIYNLEMEKVWEKLVPEQVTTLMKKHQHSLVKSKRRLNIFADYIIEYYYKKKWF